jgi:septal ring factor EnvC (AmiA/AmiB activator)
VPVLSIATALLLVFGGLMLGFYLNERGNLNDTRANLTAQVSEQKTTVAGQQEKLTAAEKKATDLNAQLEKQKTSMADVTAQRDVLAPCMRHFEAMLDATTEGGFEAAYRATKAACDKAERKMDS